MAFTLKPGQGSLHKNDRKESPKHSDCRGSVVTPDGEEFWLDGWKKETKDGKTWLSLSLKAKDGGKASSRSKRPFNDDFGI
jgi:hypothetical protein